MFDHCTALEARIATRLVDAMLSEGLALSVWEGGDYAIKRSTDRAAILEALNSTDSDMVIAFRADGARVGSVLLIWGNDEDLISDHTDNAEIGKLVQVADHG